MRSAVVMSSSFSSAMVVVGVCRIGSSFPCRRMNDRKCSTSNSMERVVPCFQRTSLVVGILRLVFSFNCDQRASKGSLWTLL